MPKDSAGTEIKVWDVVSFYWGNHKLGLVISISQLGNPIVLLYNDDDKLTDDYFILRCFEQSVILRWDELSETAVNERHAAFNKATYDLPEYF